MEFVKGSPRGGPSAGFSGFGSSSSAGSSSSGTSMEASFLEAHPTADWKPLYDRHYRKREVYDMKWDVDLSKVSVVGAPFGGPLAVSRDERKILLLKNEESLKPQTLLFTSAGKPLRPFFWERGRVVKMGWTADERLICVMESGGVILYSNHGQIVGTFTLGQGCSDEGGVLDCHIWPSGLVCMTKRFQLYAVTNIDDPRPRKLADPKLEHPPTSWCVIEPEVSSSGGVEVLLSTTTGTVLAVDAENVHDRLVSTGPFLKMSVSPTGKLLASFASTGVLWVTSVDFAAKLSEFPTNAKRAPEQLVWCGTDSVLLYWPALGILMVGPHGDWIKYTYDEPLYLIPECDGVRVITNKKCEFLQKVPNVTEEIFKIGSTAPAALLYDALMHFEKGSPKADENIRAVKDELQDAVEACIEAAGHEFSPTMQQRLLKAASFGKCFLDSYVPDSFVAMCKALRVLNAVRQPQDIGMPLTYQQYRLLTPKTLINRLINRHHHLLASRVCEYLKLPQDNVLVHWACLKVTTNNSDKEILDQVVSKLQVVPGISYAEIASTAFKNKRTELATKLLDYEPRAADQVPLLIHMQEDILALDKAIESGDTDLVYLVLLHIRRVRAPQDFFKILVHKPMALSLLIAYCKLQDLDLLKDIYYQVGQPQESANIAIAEAYQHKDLDKRVRGLQVGLNLYKDTKENFAAKATETQIRLLLLQRELEASCKDEYVGLSVTDTIYKLVVTGNSKKASKIKADFKVPDKRFWWVKIRALAAIKDWGQLALFAKEKKSPIGYRPFVEVCMAQNAPNEAALYIDKLPEVGERIELYMSIGYFREAADVAFKDLKDPAALEEIRSKAKNRQDQIYITELMQNLGKK
ncbi:Vacuolar protein sorting-associated protein 16 [Balamuthia mandrillaris]